MFLIFVGATLVITYWAAQRSRGTAAYFAANRQITAWQNGFAVAGDYMSAASFLGIAGIIAFQGYDGFMYSVGWLVAYLTVLLIVAEPLRNAGKYTMADVLAYRLNPRPVRAMASLSTLIVSTFYMIAQMVGAGALVSVLLKGIGYNTAVTGVGILMVVYVVFGGMLATTWVQITKAILLMGGTMVLSFLVLAHFGFSLSNFFDAVGQVTYTENGQKVVRDFMQPGLRFKPPYGALDLISLGMALIFGTAGLPHILVRFYTVPDARTARISVVWAMALIGVFYIMTTFLGFGAATIVGRDTIAVNGGTNMSAPLLAKSLGGEVFFGFISAIAFATILAVVAGLTISASTSFAHDFYTNVMHHGRERTGARSAGGPHGGICCRRGRNSRCDRPGSDGQRGVSRGAGVCRSSIGEPARDCLLALLAKVQHDRRRRRPRHGTRRVAGSDSDQSQYHGCRSCPLSSRKPGNSQHPTRISRGRSWNTPDSRTRGRGQVR